MNAICKPDYDVRLKANIDAEKKIKSAKNENKSTKGIIVPEVGFYEVYGVWFFGQLKESIIKVGLDQFQNDLSKTMHVFVDVKPEKIGDGVHEITVYGHKCRLYKWIAQGFHRGLIVLADDEGGNNKAEVYRQSGTWSWIL